LDGYRDVTVGPDEFDGDFTHVVSHDKVDLRLSHGEIFHTNKVE
jgi:hypothetical protein